MSQNLKIFSDFGGLSAGIPEDQWIQEIVGFESNLWAVTQLIFADYSIGIGSRVPEAGRIQQKSSTSGDKQLCQAIRMKSPGGFVSVSRHPIANPRYIFCDAD